MKKREGQEKKEQAQPGDYINIRTTKENIEGTLLESHEPDVFLIKLKSGYNMGVKKEDIYDVSIIRKAKPEEVKEAGVALKKELPSIAMLMTGGTISSRLDYATGAVKPLTKPSDLLKFYPQLFNIVNVKRLEMPFMMLSENMSGREWKKIAKTAYEILQDTEIKGIIITHGTDTLHYTAAALSFFLRNLNKPVVLTYSQRSTDRASSDAALNLQCAVHAAISDIAEVMIVGHASMNDDFCYAMPACKVRKMHTSRRDAFKAINSEPLAKIWPDGRIEKLSVHKKINMQDKNKANIKLDAVFEDKVALVKFYPGMTPDAIDFYAKNCRGIVIEMTGLGHLAVKEAQYNLLPKLKQAIKKGLIVCAAAQTLYGRLNPYVYSTGRELEKAGIIYLDDMLPETAYIKLGWVLAHREWARSRETIKKKMLENFSHELNPRIGKRFVE